jgi:glycosyltransferase involved in cell wall biosynthesis
MKLSMLKKKLLVGIYYHPEAFPPTLNALQELSDGFDNIDVICRPHIKGTWKYPQNVYVINSGRFISSSDQENSPLLRKVIFFIQFTYKLLKAAISKKPSVILLYDHHALFAYYLIRPFLFFKHMLWYHNHDVIEIERTRKYSIGWFACKAEKRLFSKIDIFTLPTSERLQFFPINKLNGCYFIIPNYPSLSFYGRFNTFNKPSNEIRIIFQGRIDEGHGLEQIINILGSKCYNNTLHLILKGYCSEQYKEKLLEIARNANVLDKVEFFGFTAYEEVPKLTASSHIGVAIFAKKDLMNETLGTASNKIYEYAAAGLPILYYRNSNVEKILKKYEWAVAVELSENSLRESIEEIILNYKILSDKAMNSFKDGLNFETHFRVVKNYILENI